MLLELFQRACVDYTHQKTAIKLLSPGGTKNLAKDPSSMSLPDDFFKTKSAVSWSRHGPSFYYVMKEVVLLLYILTLSQSCYEEGPQHSENC